MKYQLSSLSLPLLVVLLLLGVSSTWASEEGVRITVDDLPENLKYLLQGDLDTWKPPKEMSARYPYYLSGYDDDNRPIWVLEFGRYDFRGALEKGGNYTKTFHKYIDQILYRFAASIGEKPTPEDAEKQIIIIADMDGFTFDQLGTPEVIQYHITQTRKILGLLKIVRTAYVINVNFVAQTLLNLVRPLYGPEFNRLDIYGTNPMQWKSVLLKNLPKDQIPEYYGGSKDFRPVKVYG